jgi:hypothetical protein
MIKVGFIYQLIMKKFGHRKGKNNQFGRRKSSALER